MKNFIAISLLYASLFAVAVATIVLGRIFNAFDDAQVSDMLTKVLLAFVTLYAVSALLAGVMSLGQKNAAPAKKSKK